MTFFSLRAIHLILALLCLAGLGGLAACSSEPADPQAAKFVKKVNADLDRAEKFVAPPYEEKNCAVLDQALAKLFQEAAQEGKPISFAVAVLSDEGRALAARVPAPGHPEGVLRDKTGLDYSRYDKVRALIENRNTGSFVFYAPEGTVYVVCRPAKESGARGGGLCVAYDANLVEKDLGLNKKTFLALDFNS